MDSQAARAFLARDWAEAERLEQEHWARLRREEGPAALLRAAQLLWNHMRRQRPDWPGERARAEDLAHHVAQKRLLDQAARALDAH
jgi:hypothetical protein